MSVVTATAIDAIARLRQRAAADVRVAFDSDAPGMRGNVGIGAPAQMRRGSPPACDRSEYRSRRRSFAVERSVAPSAASVILSTRSAPQQRIVAQARDEIRAPDDDTGLRAAEQLVARERYETDAVGKRLLHRALVLRAVLREIDERAAAEVFDDRDAGPAPELRPARVPPTSCVKPSMR